jgi:hypothetical protein
MANPDVRETLSPILGLVETRLGMLAPLSRLRGRLDLLVDQMEESNKGNAAGDLGESLLVFQDQGNRLCSASSGFLFTYIPSSCAP